MSLMAWSRSLCAARRWGFEVKDKLKSSDSVFPVVSSSSAVHRPRACRQARGPLLMDEPTSALDPISTVMIEQLAMELKEHYT